MNRREIQPRGFVMLMALAVIALVAVAILVLAAAMSYDGQRTFDRARAAQLDQMLLAGAAEASNHLKNGTPKSGESWDIDLPAALTDQSGTLRSTVESSDDLHIVFNISARLSNRSAEQQIRFNRTENAWKLAETTPSRS